MLADVEYRLKLLQKFYTLFNSASDAIGFVNLEGVITEANQAFAQLTGYTREELKGMNINQLTPAEYRQLTAENLQQVKNTGQPRSYEKEYLRKDGSRVAILLSEFLLKDEQGQPFGFGAIIKDISERKELEVKLEKNRHRLIRQNQLNLELLSLLEITSSTLNFREALNKLLPHLTNIFNSYACLAFTVGKLNYWQPTYCYGLAAEQVGLYKTVTFSNRDWLVEETRFLRELKTAAKHLPGTLRQYLESVGAKSALILTISFESRPVVLLVLVFTKQRQPLLSELEVAKKVKKLLETYYIACSQTGKLLQDSMSLAQKLKTIAALTAIDRTIIFAHVQEEVVFGVIGLVKETLMCDLAHIFTYQPEKKEFIFVAGLENHQIAAKEKYSLSQLKTFNQLMLGNPAYLSDLAELELPLGSYESKVKNSGYRSLLIVPLLAKGEQLGLLAVASRNPAYYNAEQLLLTQQIANQIAIALSNTGLIKQLQETLVGAVNSLVEAIDAKSKWTKGHSQRVSQLAVIIGSELKLTDEQLYQLKLAALFHDVGKIGTYELVLDKPAALTKEEKDLVKKHPQKSYQILAPIPQLKEIANAAYHHHERWDGQGYPGGLSGNQIPFLARIIAVADSYDAMASDRPYRKALPMERIIWELRKEAGRQFDPDIAEALIDLLKKKGARKAA